MAEYGKGYLMLRSPHDSSYGTEGNNVAGSGLEDSGVMRGVLNTVMLVNFSFYGIVPAVVIDIA